MIPICIYLYARFIEDSGLKNDLLVCQLFTECREPIHQFGDYLADLVNIASKTQSIRFTDSIFRANQMASILIILVGTNQSSGYHNRDIVSFFVPYQDEYHPESQFVWKIFISENDNAYEITPCRVVEFFCSPELPSTPKKMIPFDYRSTS